MKTFQDVVKLLISKEVPYINYVEDLGGNVQPQYETGENLYDYSGAPILRLEAKRDGLDKLLRLTGYGRKDLAADFFYHTLDEYSTISTFDAIRERIKDVALCASYATTVAVNRYIERNGCSETEIKQLLAGSKWRWKKEDTGEYQQGTLYSDYSSQAVYIRALNHSERFTSLRISSIKPLLPFIRYMAEAKHREFVQQQYTLKNYSTKATDFFKFKVGKDPKYRTLLGIELELENHSVEEFATLNALKDHAIFKRDGSLEAGVEICTAPATLDVHKEAFKAFFDAFEENGCGLEAKSSCGMHVHIDRSKLSNLHVANLCLLLNNPDNEAHISAIAGRTPNSYCKTRKHSYYDFTSGERGDRYHRVNLTPTATLELRLFASTTKYQEFATRLEFTQAVVDYTKPGEVAISCKEIPKWEHFKSYVLKHKKAYPTLVKGM